MDWSLLGSSVHGILQARILKWGCHSLLRGIFPTEGSNLRLLHSKWNLYRWATREALNLNFLIPERWCLLQRFAIRTEFDHIREVLRSWRMTRLLSALLPLLYTREVSKQTGSIQNFLNYKLLPSPESCVQTIFLEIFSRVINSVAQSCPALCDPMDFSTPGLPVCPSPTPRVYPNSCPLSQWCHSAISSSVIPFSSHLQSFPASGSFLSRFFASGGQSIGVSASTSVLPVNTQDWFPLGWTGWISLQSKGLSRVFSNTTVQDHQFFATQLSSQSNFHIHTWLLEKP